jgi:hypothetical protein
MKSFDHFSLRFSSLSLSRRTPGHQGRGLHAGKGSIHTHERSFARRPASRLRSGRPPSRTKEEIVAIETDVMWNPLFGEPRTAQIRNGGGLNRQDHTGFQWWTLLLGVLTLASRLIFTSSPYFVDGPRHVYFIEHGQIFVSFPPGYFLFGKTAKIISDLLNVSAATAISIMNVSFSSCGAIIFANLATRLIPGILGILPLHGYMHGYVLIRLHGVLARNLHSLRDQQ